MTRLESLKDQLNKLQIASENIVYDLRQAADAVQACAAEEGRSGRAQRFRQIADDVRARQRDAQGVVYMAKNDVERAIAFLSEAEQGEAK